MRTPLLAMLVLALALGAGPAQAITIELVSDTNSLAPGESASVDIVASNFEDDEFVSAFDLGLTFDPLLLRYVANSFVVGAALGDVADVDYLDFSDFGSAASGELFTFVVALLDDADLAARQPGPGVVLASFMLTARAVRAPTVAEVGLACNSVAGPLGNDGNAVLLAVTRCGGTVIDIEPVAADEPGALPMVAFALGLLGVVRRRARPH